MMDLIDGRDAIPADPDRRHLLLDGHAELVAGMSPSQPGALYLLDWEKAANRTLPSSPPAGWTTEPSHPVRDNNENMIDIVSKPGGYPTRNGNYAVRFDLRNTDRIPGDSSRAELGVWPPEPRNAERWYGLSVYLQDWAPDRARDTVFQWHQGGQVPCPHGCSPHSG